MNAMLLAAGEGTRLRPYTSILPKPAIPFLTVPLAAHVLGFLRGQKLDKLVVNTFHLPNKIHELFHTLPHGAQELHFSDEVGQILGSGGGLSKARSHFIGGGDFLLMNADEVILPEDFGVLRKALDQHKKNKALSTILVMDHPGVGTQFGGVWSRADNKVVGFGKTPVSGSQKAWHFIGVQILSEEIFKYLPSSGESNILYDAVAQGIAEGKTVQVFPINCSWFETGNPGDFLAASAQCFKYLSSTEDTFQKKALLETIKKYSAEKVSIKNNGISQQIISESATIDPSATLEGLVVVGPNARVGKSCHLKNVIISTKASVPEKTEAFDQLFVV